MNSDYMKTAWRRVGHHSGVLRAVQVPMTPEDIERLHAKQKKLKEKAWKREKPIRYLPDTGKIEKLCRKSGVGLGGKIADIISRKPTHIEVEGVTVAAVRVGIYVEIDVEDLELAKNDPLRKELLSDCITVTLYRNPKSPKHLKAKY